MGSSSSSDSDDPYAYQLPPRRAYGGVRISYVPNDRFALSHRHSHRHLGGRRSLRVTPGPAESPAPPPHIGQLRRETQSQQRTEDRTLDKFTKFEGCDSVIAMFGIQSSTRTV